MKILEKLFKKKFKTGNQINVVHPYVWFNQWVFDDPDVGLIKEPFVAGADSMIDLMTDNADSCTLVFSKDKFPTAEHKITKVKGDGYGTDYIYDTIRGSLKLWLCPALLKYFTKAPKHIYFQVKVLSH